MTVCTPASPVAGQQKSIAMKRSKCPRLTLTPPDKSKLGLEVNLGSPFIINFQFRSPLSGTFETPQTAEFRNTFAYPPGLSPSSYDSESEDSDWDDDSDRDDAQYISIPSSSPFYVPPPTPRPFSFTPFSDPSSLSFASDALCDEESCSTGAAAMFHEELDRILPDFDEKTFVLNSYCLLDMDNDLLLSPTEVFTQTCFDSMKRTNTLLPAPWARYSHKVLPDVPVNCDEFEDDSEGNDGSDVDTSDDDESGDKTTCHLTLPPKPKPRPIDASPSLDRRLVAPFEQPEHLTIAPSKANNSNVFRGLFR